MEVTAQAALDLTDETRAVLDALPVAISAGVAVRDAAGRIIDLQTILVNAAAERVTGVPRERLVGARIGEAVPGFAESELFARVVRLIETGEGTGGYETPWWRGEDDVGVFLVEGVRFGDGFLAVFNDVTESRKADADLRASEARLAEAQRIAELGVWEWDIRRDRVIWSDELFRIFGVSPAEYTPSYQGYIDRVHAEDRERVEGVLAEAAREGRPFTFDDRIVRPDGTVRLLHCGGRVTLDEKGRPTRMLGVCHDITERTQAEGALTEARADIERRRFAERQAAQINEGIIDGLVTAMRALDAGDPRAVRQAMTQTLEQASRIVTDLRALPSRRR
ncbi:MAG TPA: PAS domain-containing protein [Solirubrobacteraceae bacterium]|jgi:PAS domain S-box-containing protein